MATRQISIEWHATETCPQRGIDDRAGSVRSGADRRPSPDARFPSAPAAASRTEAVRKSRYVASMTKTTYPAGPVLGARALNRSTLERQLLLRPVSMSAGAAVEHLLGLQAQNVKPPYYALAARLDGFVPEELSTLMAYREAVRIVSMRSTIHTHTADDCLTLRPFVQPARDRELTYFRKGLTGVDLDRLAVLARDLVEAEPRTMKQLREALSVEWPDADPQSLAVAARCRLAPRPGHPARTVGQERAGRAHHRRALAGPAPRGAPRRRTPWSCAIWPPSARPPSRTCRPGSLTRLRDAFERLRPDLLTFRDEHGVELFDLPDAPRPDPHIPAPPRFLPEFDNLLLSHADRTRVVPAEYRGRSWQGNQAYCTLLVDGFLAGVWKLEEDALVVEPFGTLTKAQRQEVAAEGERMLATVHPGQPHDIRFGTVVRS